jgi:hypothetical protein
MTAVVDYFRRVRSRQVVRPWALCTPVVVLLIALPLLRPLRAPGGASENELSRLATIQALVEHDGQAINGTTPPPPRLRPRAAAPRGTTATTCPTRSTSARGTTATSRRSCRTCCPGRTS